jgi:hypothetical protein
MVGRAANKSVNAVKQISYCELVSHGITGQSSGQYRLRGARKNQPG